MNKVLPNATVMMSLTDHENVNRKFVLRVRDVHVYRGAGVCPDHFHVLAKTATNQDGIKLQLIN